MSLENPNLIWSLFLLPLLLFLVGKRNTTRTYASKSFSFKKLSSKRPFILLAILGVALSSLLLVLASSPFVDEAQVDRSRPGIDIVIAWDLSESMEATDYDPNRLVVSKKVIHDFIQKRKSDRIGLVVFAGEAVTKSPLTDDYRFLHKQVEDARLRELKQGTAIGMALATAVTRLRHSKSKSRVIVLLTDGDSNVGTINPMTASYLAKAEGIRIYSIGIGREDRVIVPIYAYDDKGRKGPLMAQVPSYLNPELLEKISRTTGGQAYMARDTEALSRVLGEVDKLERTSVKSKVSFMKRYLIKPLGTVALLAVVFLMVWIRTRFWWRQYGATV